MSATGNVGYNYLGASGLKVSNICLGTMTFGTCKGSFSLFESSRQLDEKQSHEVLDKYVELGGNFLDTANVYCKGKSEEIIGNWLQKQKRDRIVLATKCRIPMDDSDVNKCGLSRRHIVQSVEESLARLKTNYIDLLQAHAWDNATPIEETMRTFDDLVRCGKIRYYGFSNVCGWQLQKIVDFAKYNRINLPISLQQQYSLLCRQSEWEEFMVCKNEGLGVLPWGALKSGFLSGKFKRGEKPNKTQSRVGFYNVDEKVAKEVGLGVVWNDYVENDAYWNLIDKMGKIAATHGKSIPQVAIRWLLQQDVVASVIIGATSVKQLEDNMGASAGWELTKEEMAALDAWGKFVMKEINNGTATYKGLCMDLLAELAFVLNFSYVITEPADGKWGEKYANGSWAGLVGQLEREEVDMVVAPLAAQKQREEVMDFTYAFHYDYTTVILKKPDPNRNKWFTLIDPFRWEVLVGIITAVPLMALVLRTLEKYNPYHSKQEYQRDSTIVQGNRDWRLDKYQHALWYLYGALLAKGGVIVPRSITSRTFLSFWGLFAVVVMGTYSGNLTAFLTVTKYRLPFETLAEMVEHKQNGAGGHLEVPYGQLCLRNL